MYCDAVRDYLRSQCRDEVDDTHYTPEHEVDSKSCVILSCRGASNLSGNSIGCVRSRREGIGQIQCRLDRNTVRDPEATCTASRCMRVGAEATSAGQSTSDAIVFVCSACQDRKTSRKRIRTEGSENDTRECVAYQPFHDAGKVESNPCAAIESLEKFSGQGNAKNQMHHIYTKHSYTRRCSCTLEVEKIHGQWHVRK